MRRFLIGLVLGLSLASGVAVADGWGWFAAKVKLTKDHKAGETIECSTSLVFQRSTTEAPWNMQTVVSCTEP